MSTVGCIFCRVLPGFLLMLLTEGSLQGQNQLAPDLPFISSASSAYQPADTLGQPRLKQVLRELHEKYGIYFLYADSDLGDVRVNRVPLGRQPVADLLTAILKGSGLSFRQSNENTFIIVTDTGIAGSILQKIAGRIINPDGEPVPFVTINVKGTRRSGTADANGRFEIEATTGDVLLVSCIGFRSLEWTITETRPLNLTMNWIETELEEVKVLALGIESLSKSLGYSVSSLSGRRLQLVRENNIANSLAGWVPGLNSSTPQTGPGASSRVTIRGNSSLSFDNQPFYIVNGIPINNDNLGSAGKFGGADFGDGISSINTDDVESLQILRGAAAAALYGQRGRNGVILIQTKSGKQSKRPVVSYNNNTQLDFVRDFTRFQRKYGQGFQGEAPASQDDALNSGLYSWGAALTGIPASYFDGSIRPFRAIDGSNLNHFYETGLRVSQTLAVNAGSEFTQWRFSLGDLRSRSVYPNARFNRQTANFNIHYQLSPKWQGYSYLQYSRELGRNRPNVNDAPGNGNFAILFLPPNVDARWLKPGYDENGYEILYNDNAFNTNPYFAANKFQNDTDRDRVWGVTQIKYQWSQRFSLQARLAHDFFAFRASSITPTGTAYKPEGTINLERTYDYHETNADLLAQYHLSLNNNLNLQLSAGANLLRMRARVLDVSADGLAFPFLYSPANSSNNSVSRLRPRKNVHSVYAAAQLDWKKTAFFTVTDRNDWSSTLPVGRNSYNYPSASISYLVNKHLNWKNLDLLRLRAAYAQVGGDAPLFATHLYYSSTGTIGGAPIGTIENQIPNSSLEPLQVREWELGWEAGLWNNRLHFDMAWYNKETLNDIVAATVSVASGYRSAIVNVGQIVNTGVELQVSGTPVQGKALGWTTELNFALNRNRVKRLYRDQVSMQVANGESRTERAFIQHIQGLPFAQIMVYDIRRNEAGLPILNNSGLQPSQELIAAGTAIHPFTGGWANRVEFNRWALEWLVDFKAGGFIYSGTEATAIQRGLHPMTLQGRENAVLVEGVNSNGAPALVHLTAQQYYESLYRISILQVQNASFIKFRSFSLSWQLPENWTKKWNASASISLVGRNLFYFYRRTRHIDPEANYTHSNAQGLENGSLPALRSLGIHLQIQFQ